MRQAILSFLLLCSAIAFGQQPQWTTVASLVLFNQNQGIPLTTLLTPTEPGIYRLNLYFSGGGGGAGLHTYFAAQLFGTDITGQSVVGSGQVFCRTAGAVWMPPIMVSLKPNEPLTYSVEATGLPTAACQYNLAITVEQLVQQ